MNQSRLPGEETGMMRAVNQIDCPESASSEQQGGSATVCNSPDAARILIVEDDADICSLLVYTLERVRLNPVASTNCKSAWQILSGNPPDLVLLDWMLPDMSGLELTRHLRDTPQFAHLPIVVVSTRDRPQDRLAGLEAGADAYLTKQGLEARELVSLVARVGGGG